MAFNDIKHMMLSYADILVDIEEDFPIRYITDDFYKLRLAALIKQIGDKEIKKEKSFRLLTKAVNVSSGDVLDVNEWNIKIKQSDAFTLICALEDVCLLYYQLTNHDPYNRRGTKLKNNYRKLFTFHKLLIKYIFEEGYRKFTLKQCKQLAPLILSVYDIIREEETEPKLKDLPESCYLFPGFSNVDAKNNYLTPISESLKFIKEWTKTNAEPKTTNNMLLLLYFMYYSQRKDTYLKENDWVNDNFTLSEVKLKIEEVCKYLKDQSSLQQAQITYEEKIKQDEDMKQSTIKQKEDEEQQEKLKRQKKEIDEKEEALKRIPLSKSLKEADKQKKIKEEEDAKIAIALNKRKDKIEKNENELIINSLDKFVTTEQTFNSGEENEIKKYEKEFLNFLSSLILTEKDTSAIIHFNADCASIDSFDKQQEVINKTAITIKRNREEKFNEDGENDGLTISDNASRKVAEYLVYAKLDFVNGTVHGYYVGDVVEGAKNIFRLVEETFAKGGNVEKCEKEFQFFVRSLISKSDVNALKQFNEDCKTLKTFTGKHYQKQQELVNKTAENIKQYNLNLSLEDAVKVANYIVRAMLDFIDQASGSYFLEKEGVDEYSEFRAAFVKGDAEEKEKRRQKLLIEKQAREEKERIEQENNTKKLKLEEAKKRAADASQAMNEKTRSNYLVTSDAELANKQYNLELVLKAKELFNSVEESFRRNDRERLKRCRLEIDVLFSPLLSSEIRTDLESKCKTIQNFNDQEKIIKGVVIIIDDYFLKTHGKKDYDVAHDIAEYLISILSDFSKDKAGARIKDDSGNSNNQIPSSLPTPSVFTQLSNWVFNRNKKEINKPNTVNDKKILMQPNLVIVNKNWANFIIASK